MEQRLSLITLGVNDMDRARTFYEKGLGWTAAAASTPEMCLFQLGGLVLALYDWNGLAKDAALPAGSSGGFSGITLAHNVETRAEVDAVMDRAASAGGTVIKSARDAFWGGYHGYFTDPDGHVWEVAWNPYFPLDATGAITLPV